MDEALAARGILKRYGGVTALAGADLVLRPGEVHALLGENGAGKSTLVKVLAGSLQPDGGQVLMGGRPVRLDGPRDAWRRGTRTVSQELSLFPQLDVLTNLFVHDPPTRGGLMDRTRMAALAAPHLAALGLRAPLGAPVGSLSLAEQQLVEIARALIGEPAVLVLDEPTSALAEAATRRLLQVVRGIADRGVAVLYVSHFLQEITAIADRVTVLRDGRNTRSGVPSAGLSVEDMVEAMLGDRSAPVTARATSRAAAGGVTARGISVPGRLHGVDLRLPAGQIVGLAGLEGAGHPSVLAALWGWAPSATGTLSTPSGSFPLPRNPAQALALGMAFIPSDRKGLGLMLDKTVWENITSVWALALGGGGPLIRPGRLRAIARRWIEELRIRADVDTPVAALSGGNEQKVVVAKWLQLNPTLFLLDDPSRGVDVRARAELHQLIRTLAGRGCSVAICSTDMLELAELCDRVVLLRQGRVVRDAEPDELTEAGLVRALNLLPSVA